MTQPHGRHLCYAVANCGSPDAFLAPGDVNFVEFCHLEACFFAQTLFGAVYKDAFASGIYFPSPMDPSLASEGKRTALIAP